jgi:hypothetical protein
MSEVLETNYPRKAKRAQGMPDARCTRGRLCSKKAQAQARNPFDLLRRGGMDSGFALSRAPE